MSRRMEMVAAAVARAWGVTVASGLALLFLAGTARPFSLRSHGLPACQADLSTCQEHLQTCETGLGAAPAQLLATGQTSCWNTPGNPIACAGTGQDGEFKAGAALSYTDNDDGTISDTNTGLMWEKLCDEDPPGATCPAEHDMESSYLWGPAFKKIETLNTAPCFAGHCDWRLPNVRELASLFDYQISSLDSPLVPPEFDTACQAPCSVTTCSCTSKELSYWSSTSVAPEPSLAWSVNFFNGDTGFEGKGSFELGVRAVRGGL